MYIRKVTHVDRKNRKEYYTYKLVESVRTEKGPSQLTLLNLSTKLRRQGINHSWDTIRKGLSTHVRISTIVKRDDGKTIHIRKSSRPEPFHIQIYNALKLPIAQERPPFKPMALGGTLPKERKAQAH